MISGYVAVQILFSNSRKKDLIDCYYITIIPTILGLGIRLFGNVDHGI